MTPPTSRRLVTLAWLTLAAMGSAALQIRAQDVAPELPLLRQVPANADFILAMRPKELIAHPFGEALYKSLAADPHLKLPKGFEIDWTKIDECLLAGRLPLAGRIEGVLLLKAERGLVASKFSRESSVGGIGSATLFQVTGTSLVWGEVDATTVILGEMEDVKQSLTPHSPAPLLSTKAWRAASGAPAAASIHTKMLQSLMMHEDPKGVRTLQGALAKQLREWGAIAPLWEKSQALSLHLSLTKLAVEAALESGDTAQANELAVTLSAFDLLAQNWLNSRLKTDLHLSSFDRALYSLAKRALEKKSQKTTEEVVLASFAIPESELTSLRPLLTGAIRTDEMRIKSQNNLKQLALAMHNYHDVYGTFPPAVLHGGSDGKTPYSWRVAILPFLEQGRLFDQYKFDEPWDSDANKKVLDQVPDVFQDATEVGKSTSTSYVAIAGFNTIINARPVGAKMATITDGTSNTIMLVEAKVDIPWTKPEDLSDATAASDLGYDRSDFYAALGDGSVRKISKSIDPKMLSWLFLRNDGNVVTIP